MIPRGPLALQQRQLAGLASLEATVRTASSTNPWVASLTPRLLGDAAMATHSRGRFERHQRRTRLFYS